MGVPIPRTTSKDAIEDLGVVLGERKALCSSGRAACVVHLLRRLLVVRRGQFLCRVREHGDGVLDPGARLVLVVHKVDIATRPGWSVLRSVVTRVAAAIVLESIFVGLSKIHLPCHSVTGIQVCDHGAVVNHARESTVP